MDLGVLGYMDREGRLTSVLGFVFKKCFPEHKMYKKVDRSPKLTCFYFFAFTETHWCPTFM